MTLHTERGLFWIQAGDPRMQDAAVCPGESLTEAIEKCFPMLTEAMFLQWNGVSIPVSYKYDLSIIAEDVALMVRTVCGASAGEWTNCWPSNTFFAEWRLTWNDIHVSVHAAWKAVAGRALALLDEEPAVCLRKSDFLSEWKRPLALVMAALRRAGYAERDVPAMRDLAEALAMLPEEGTLYRGPGSAPPRAV